MRKKALSPAARREAAQRLSSSGLCSARAACRILKLARSTYRYCGRPPSEEEAALQRRLQELSEQHPRYGYRRIAALLRQEGWAAGKRLVQRWRRQSGLRVPPTRRKQARRGVSTGLPTKALHRGHVWTWDFIADSTVRGGALRILRMLLVLQTSRRAFFSSPPRDQEPNPNERATYAAWPTRHRPEPGRLEVPLRRPTGSRH